MLLQRAKLQPCDTAYHVDSAPTVISSRIDHILPQIYGVNVRDLQHEIISQLHLFTSFDTS